MHYIINPLDLDSTEKKLLHELLTKHPSHPIWLTQTKYIIGQDTVELTHGVTPSPKNSEPAIKKYRVFSTRILYAATQASRETQLLFILGELCFLEGELMDYDALEESLIIKIQRFVTHKSKTNEIIDRITHEYRNSLMLEHLGMEIPLIQVKVNHKTDLSLIESALVMKKVPGIELYDFIDAFHKTSIYLPCTTRMQLTLALLDAFKTQIYKSGLFHGDLKPENIILDMGIGDHVLPRNPSDTIATMQLKIIDVAGAQRYGKPIKYVSVSPYYIAPEMSMKAYIETKNGGEYSPVLDEKPDIYALGQIMALIWNWGFGSIPMENETFQDEFIQFYQYFFSNDPSWFTVDCLWAIYQVISEAMNPDPTRRSSLDDIISKMDCINIKYFRNTVQSNTTLPQSAPPHRHQLFFSPKPIHTKRGGLCLPDESALNTL